VHTVGSRQADRRPRMLITGGSGLLGSNLSLLYSAWAEVWTTYRSHPVRLAAAHTVRIDLTDAHEVSALVADVRPETVIHCAAMTDVDQCEEHPDDAARANTLASAVVARAAGSVNARMMHISTDSVFDGVRGGYTEADAPRPLNVYARTKLDSERAVLDESPGALVVRTNIYGWNAQPKWSLAEWILGRLENGETVPGFEDVFFSPILVNDLAVLLERLSGSSTRGVLHVAGSERASKHDFAIAIADVFGLDRSLVRRARLDSARLPAQRPRDTSLACAKAIELGLRLPAIADGLSHFAALRAAGYPESLNYMSEGANT
jgi:dTDP-4-dehydrorhamnose reductase